MAVVATSGSLEGSAVKHPSEGKGVGVDRFRYGVWFLCCWALTALGFHLLDRIMVAWAGDALGQEPLLQPFWDWIVTTFPWTVSHAGFGGAVGLTAFFVTSAYFTVLDVCRSNTKIQKDWWPSTYDLLEAAVPQMTIYVVANGLGYAYGHYPLTLPKEAPRLAAYAWQVLVSFVMGDLWMYLEHRVMHAIPFLRTHIHSVHHGYHAPFSWAGGVVHPLEDLVVVFGQSFVPLAFGFHPLAFWTHCFLWVALLVEQHSGHDVAWAPYRWMPFAQCPCGGGGAPHDIHHYKVTKNFSFCLCVWDIVFGTFEPVVEPMVRLPIHKETWWEFQRQQAREEAKARKAQ